jgi:hypothetical protein
LRGNLIHDVHRSTYAHGGAPNNGFFSDEGSSGFLFESNVVHTTSGEPVRFNQCERDWHPWKGNAFGGDATAERIAEAAARVGLEPPYQALASGQPGRTGTDPTSCS